MTQDQEATKTLPLDPQRGQVRAPWGQKLQESQRCPGQLGFSLSITETRGGHAQADAVESTSKSNLDPTKQCPVLVPGETPPCAEGRPTASSGVRGKEERQATWHRQGPRQGMAAVGH